MYERVQKRRKPLIGAILSKNKSHWGQIRHFNKRKTVIIVLRRILTLKQQDLNKDTINNEQAAEILADENNFGD